jgi:hypothetical protein
MHSTVATHETTWSVERLRLGLNSSLLNLKPSDLRSDYCDQLCTYRRTALVQMPHFAGALGHELSMTPQVNFCLILCQEPNRSNRMSLSIFPCFGILMGQAELLYTCMNSKLPCLFLRQSVRHQPTLGCAFLSNRVPAAQDIPRTTIGVVERGAICPSVNCSGVRYRWPIGNTMATAGAWQLVTRRRVGNVQSDRRATRAVPFRYLTWS